MLILSGLLQSYGYEKICTFNRSYIFACDWCCGRKYSYGEAPGTYKIEKLIK